MMPRMHSGRPKGRGQRVSGKGPHRHAGGGRKHAFRRGPSGGNKPIKGPRSCPMCGAVVSDLAAHIRDRHDDADSHPRD